MTSDPAEWLARVRHDLVKRLVWPARDRRDLGGAPAPGELTPRLIDDEGQPTTPRELWAVLEADAPAGVEAAVGEFGGALERAADAAAADDVAGVLELETAFDELGRAVAEQLARFLEGN
jgi:hypothetical protein